MFSTISKSVFFSSVASLALFTAATPGLTADLAVAVDASLLNSSLNFGSQQITTPINKYANGVWTSGSAVTSADVQVLPWLNDGSLGLQLTMSSYTNGATFSQTLPRPSILVEFNATIESWGSTSKLVGFSEQGFFSYGAQSQVQSSITFGDLQTSSWGLFWRLKERIAYQRAYEELMRQKAQQEFDASQEVAGQLQSNIDQRTNSELYRWNQLYQEKIYQPYIANSTLQGRLRFATESGRFLIAAGDIGEARQLPATNALEPVVAEVGSGFLQAFLSKFVSGKHMTGEEVIKLLLPSGAGGDLEDSLDMDALRNISLDFSSQNAVLASTDEDGVSLILLLTRLQDGSAAGTNLKVTIRIAISEEDGAIILDLDQPIKVEAATGPALSADLQRKLQSMVRKVIPAVTVDLKGKSFTVAGMALQLSRLKASPAGIQISLKRGAEPIANSNNGSGNRQDLGGLCATAGGQWRNGSECDCNRIWFRADAIEFYGAEEFVRQCRSYL